MAKIKSKAVTKPQKDFHPKQLVRRFLDSIAWSDKCFRVANGFGEYYLLTPNHILYPILVSDFDASLERVFAIAKDHNKLPGLIIAGDCSEAECERIFFTAGRLMLNINWDQAQQKMWAIRFFVKATDGIDILGDFFAYAEAQRKLSHA